MAWVRHRTSRGSASSRYAARTRAAANASTVPEAASPRSLATAGAALVQYFLAYTVAVPMYAYVGRRRALRWLRGLGSRAAGASRIG
jgi:hypothetical protein